MHNFPHQISSLDKFFSALEVFKSVVDETGDLGDDGVVGTALAKAGVYAFRGDLTLAANLKLERAKPRPNRGTEAAARDHRRFFLLSQLIEKNNSPSRYGLTAAAQGLLASPAGSTRVAAWRNAMTSLKLETGPNSHVHPYRVMVRLVSTFPGIEKRKLLLALEANDDTNDEFNRISTLAQLTFPTLLTSLNITDHSAANAVKILPSIAQQLGDIVLDGVRCMPAAIPHTTEEGTVLIAPAIAAPPENMLVSIDASLIAAMPTFVDSGTVTVDLGASIAARKKRTLEHQEGVPDGQVKFPHPWPPQIPPGRTVGL